MKGTLVGVVLLALAGTGSLMAQNRDWRADRDWRNANHGHHQAYGNYRHDGDLYRDMRHDEREIDHDRWEIRQDMRRGDYAAARREREEMRERERDLYRDRREAYGNRERCRDDRHVRNWGYGRDRNWNSWARYAGWGRR